MQNKSQKEHLADLFIYGQIFIEELEYFQQNKFEGITLFQKSLKKDVQKVINNVSKKVNEVFSGDVNKESILCLYDVENKLQNALKSLTMDKKLELIKSITKE